MFERGENFEIYCHGELMHDEGGMHCRLVAFVGKYVFKLDTNSPCGRQCRQEYETYQILRKKDKKFFAKVVAFGEWEGRYFIVQERVIPSMREFSSEELKDFRRITNLYCLEDVLYLEDEDAMTNFLITENSFKIYDFGGFGDKF